MNFQDLFVKATETVAHGNFGADGIPLQDWLEEQLGRPFSDDELDAFGDWKTTFAETAFCLLHWHGDDRFGTWTEHFAITLGDGSTLVCLHDADNPSHVVACLAKADENDLLAIVTTYYEPWFDEEGEFTSPVFEARTDLTLRSPVLDAILRER